MSQVTFTIGPIPAGPEGLLDALVKQGPRRPMQKPMFVEGVRMFVVVLCTAAAFWASRSLGTTSAGLVGMLGCLFGYVSGGLLGRGLDRALGAVEKRVAPRSPARFLAGSLGAVAGAGLALVLVLPLALLLPPQLAVSIAGLVAWIIGWLGYRIFAHQSVAVLELLGLSTRPLVRAQPFDTRDGLLVDTSQRITTPSFAPDARVLPSALKASVESVFLCPLRVAVTWP